jgi:protein subunit release factor A
MLKQPPASNKEEAPIEEATAAPKKQFKPAVTFNESELDMLLSKDAIDQEVKKMLSKGVAPSQRLQFKEITADVTEAVRWQENKNQELHEMKTNDTQNANPWIIDLTEDFVTYGLSPANTKDEAKIILENLDNDLKAQAEAGFGPEARDYIFALRKELELLIEKL